MINKISVHKPTALSDWTYQFLKEKILNLEFKPGEQLHIEEFAKELGVSRTPIREAFLRLANESLLEIRPRVGYFVSEITEEDIRDLFEAREILEAWAAKKAAERLTDEDLENLKVLIAETSKAVESGDYTKFLENEIKFHDQLQGLITNQRVIALMDSLNDLTHRERVLSIQSKENVELTLVEHQRILAALIKRDGNQAEWYMGEHLHNVCLRLVELVNSMAN